MGEIFMNKNLIFVTHLQPKIKLKIHQINFMIEFVFFYSFVIFVNILGFNTIHVVSYIGSNDKCLEYNKMDSLRLRFV